MVMPEMSGIELTLHPSWIDTALERVCSVELIMAQNLIAASPKRRPSVVTARLERIRSLQVVCHDFINPADLREVPCPCRLNENAD